MLSTFPVSGPQAPSNTEQNAVDPLSVPANPPEGDEDSDTEIEDLPGPVRPTMVKKERLTLLDDIMQADDFEKTGIVYQPVDTNVSDQQATVLHQLVASGAAGAGSQEEDQNEDEERDDDDDGGDDSATVNGAPEMPDEETISYQRKMLSLSAEGPSYRDACTNLGLMPEKPALGPPDRLTVLKPWQVCGVSWMLDQEQTRVKGGILADACGLGKTLTALSLVHFAALRPSWDTNSIHRPTLILCPSTLIETWLSEISSRFGDLIDVILFYGTPESMGLERRDIIVRNREALKAKLEALHPKDPRTSRTVVLSAYTTWVIRTTKKLKVKKDGETHDDEETDLQTDGDAGRVTDAGVADAINRLASMQDSHRSGRDQRTTNRNQKPGKGRKPSIIFKSLMRGGYFARVIADEGHNLKTIKRRKHQSVGQLDAEHVWFLTATPLSNRSLDLCGYLAILYEEMKRRPAGYGAADNDEDDTHDPVTEYKIYSNMTTVPDPKPYHLLSPKRFAALASGGHLAARRGYHTLPIIMRLTCLSRDMGHPIDSTDPSLGTIGDDIPNMRLMTVDIKHSERVQRDHDKRYFDLIEELRGSGPEGEKGKDGRTPNNQDNNGSTGPSRMQGKSTIEAAAAGQDSHGTINWGIMRTLCLLSFTPKLESFLTRVGKRKTLAETVAGYADREDRGFSYFWRATNRVPDGTIPADRIQVAWYILESCPKLRYLFKLFADEGLWSVSTTTNTANTTRGTRRFLLFCQWPLVMWYTEMFLDALCIPYVTIRSTMTPSQRLSAISRFCDAGSTCSVLLTTFAVGSHGLNLHKACSRVVILEPALNLNTLLQAVGRVHRLGQVDQQKIWILFQDHTISRWVECNSARKALPQIAAQLHDVLKEKIDEAAEGAEVEDLDGMGSSGDIGDDGDPVAIAESTLIKRFAAGELCRILGQRASRLDMGDVMGLGLAKSHDKEEGDIKGGADIKEEMDIKREADIKDENEDENEDKKQEDKKPEDKKPEDRKEEDRKEEDRKEDGKDPVKRERDDSEDDGAGQPEVKRVKEEESPTGPSE